MFYLSKPNGYFVKSRIPFSGVSKNRGAKCQNHMEQSYRKYLSFSQRDLALHLERQSSTLTPLEKQEILRVVGEERSKLRSANAQKRYADTAWKELLHPLNVERRIVASMLRYKSKAYRVPERDKAVAAYSEVLDKVRRLLTTYQKDHALPPSKLAKEKHAPNNGEHWTDWVPSHVKAKVCALFDAIPKNYKAKVKTPFERRILDTPQHKRRINLAQQVKRELAAAYKDLATEPEEYDNPDHHAYIERLHLAEKAVAALSEEDHIPKTWQALFGASKANGAKV
jgi:hypothetical protein